MANDKRTIHGINITAPGGIDELLAYHRQTFGDATMEAGAGDGGEGSEGTGEGSGEGTGAEGGDGTQDNSEGDKKGLTDEEHDEGKTYDQKYVSSLRKESGDYRHQRNEARTQLATAEQERDSLKDQLAAINKIFNPDADDKSGDQVDADAITKANQDLKRENAILRLAPKNNADFDKLTDSRKFMESIKDIDPTNVDELSAKIKAAIQENPALGTGSGSRKSGGDLGGGSGEKSLSLEKFKAMSYEEQVALYRSNKPEYDRLSKQL